MEVIEFHTHEQFQYHWCGLFLPPNEEWMHTARGLSDYELMVVTEGTLYVADTDTKYEVKAGEYLLMTPTVLHHGYRRGACSFYWMHFNYHNNANDHRIRNEKELQYSPDTLLLPRQGTLASPDRIIILMKQLQDSDRRYREPNLNRSLCTAILCETAVQSTLYRNYGSMNSGQQIFEDIVNYINWHINEPLPVYEVAAYFGYNEKYLTTFFRNMSGIPLKQYILRRKMEHATAALTETNQPVSQIAYSLGYSDVHNFTNAFHKIVGLSPTEYRAGYNKRNVFRV